MVEHWSPKPAVPGSSPGTPEDFNLFDSYFSICYIGFRNHGGELNKLKKFSKIILPLIGLVILVGAVFILNKYLRKPTQVKAVYTTSADGSTVTFTSDYHIDPWNKNFENKNIVVQTEPRDVAPTLTIDSDSTGQNGTALKIHSFNSMQVLGGARVTHSNPLPPYNNNYAIPDTYGGNWKFYLDVSGSSLSTYVYDPDNGRWRQGSIRDAKLAFKHFGGGAEFSVKNLATNQEWIKSNWNRISGGPSDSNYNDSANDTFTTDKLSKGFYEIEVHFRKIAGQNPVGLQVFLYGLHTESDYTYQPVFASVPSGWFYAKSDKTQQNLVNSEYYYQYLADPSSDFNSRFSGMTAANSRQEKMEKVPTFYFRWDISKFNKSPLLFYPNGLRIKVAGELKIVGGQLLANGNGYMGGLTQNLCYVEDQMNKPGFGPGGGPANVGRDCVGSGGSFGGLGRGEYNDGAISNYNLAEAERQFQAYGDPARPSQELSPVSNYHYYYYNGFYHPVGGCGANDGPTWFYDWTYNKAQKYTIPFGSGGAAGASKTGAGYHNTWVGGNGGGLIYIEADSVNIQGPDAILANGTDGQELHFYTGGGSGGGIEIWTNHWQNNPAPQPSLAPLVYSGDNINPGGSGWTQTESQYGTICIDNNGDATCEYVYDATHGWQPQNTGNAIYYGSNIKAIGGKWGGGGGRIAIHIGGVVGPVPEKTIEGNVFSASSITVDGSATGVVEAGTGNVQQVKILGDLATIAPYTINANSTTNWASALTISQNAILRLVNEKAKPYSQISANNLNPENNPEGGVWYKTNGLVLDGQTFKNRGTIIVDGNLTFKKGMAPTGPNDMVGFIVRDGNVVIEGPVENLYAAIFAPNGNITIEAAADPTKPTNILGLLVAKSIIIQRNNIVIKYNPKITGQYYNNIYYIALPGFSQIIPPVWKEKAP